MIAALRTFAWFRWRLLANSLRADRRDTIEQISRIASLVVPGLLVVTSTGSVVMAVLGGWVAGWRSATDLSSSVWILTVIRALLVVVTAFVALAPVIIGVHGGAGRHTRLMLLPVPRRLLHLVEVVTTLLDPWVIFVLPGLVSYALGLTIGAVSRPEPWVRHWALDGAAALAAGVLIAFVLASVASLMTFLIGWIVRDRRRGELFAIVFVVALGCAALVPAFLSRDFGRDLAGGARRQALPSAMAWTPSDWPAWTTALPSELYAEAVVLGYDVPEQDRIWPLTMLALEGAVLFALSAIVHGTVDQLAEGGRAYRNRAMAGVVAVRLPGMWPGTSAVALAGVRTALRSVRGRLVVLLPGPLAAMLAMFVGGLRMPESLAWIIAARGYLAFGGGLLLGLFAAQAITLNQFASDRAGLTLEFLAPIRDVDLVRGKTVGCAVLILAGGAISFVCAWLVAPGGSPWLWIATLAGGMATFLATSPLAAWLSIALPIASDLSKTGTAGNPHRLAMVAGSLAIAVAAAPAAAILGVFPPETASLAMAVWLATVLAVSVPGLSLAARAIGPRRENLALVAQGR
jgi:hypothetical protein